MNKIIMIFAVILLFCQCNARKEENSYSGKKETENEDNVSSTRELIFTKDCCFPDVADKYEYPDYGFLEWSRMPSEERLHSCQLPDEALKSISTLGLIRSFIDVPWEIGLSISLSSCACYRLNYYNLYQIFNSVQELLTREDASKSLIVYYVATKLDCYESIEEFSQDNWRSPERDLFFRLKALEYLFTRPEILDRLSHREKVEVVKSFLAKHEEWQSRKINNYSMIPALAIIMGDDMLPYFDETTLDDIRIAENYSEKYLYDVIVFAERFINKN